MTAPIQDNQAQTNDKELNFRKQQAMYERMLQEKEQRIAHLEQERQVKAQPQEEEDEDNSDPYVDHKKLNKRLAKQSQSTQSEIQKAVDHAKHSAKQEIRQEMWLENHKDFFNVMKLADKFAAEAPELAEDILAMPEGFERQKLVYNNIKKLGIDKPEQQRGPSIQDKVDANRQNPGYQSSGVGSGPYGQIADFTESGQKAAYEKMQKLRQNLRI